jgi:Tol biopolymer transport system component
MGTTNFDLWTVELGTGALSRITSDAGVFAPVWSPDGGRIFFGAFMGTPVVNVYSIRSDGVGGATRLTNVDELQMPLDVTRDGRRLLFAKSSGRPQLATMPVDAAGEPALLFGTPFAEIAASLSPDDRWVAYESNESGQAEISVRPVEPGAARVPVSTGGGQRPRWSPDGRTIFFRQGRAVMAAPVTIRPDAVDVGRPEVVFETTPEEGLSQTFSVSPESERFLFVRQRGNERITLVLNWPVEAARNDEER